MARKPWVKVQTKLTKAHVSLIDQLAIIQDKSRAGWMRDALVARAYEEWALTPGRPLWIRPNTRVYKRDGDRFRQVAQTLGGERCWLIEVVGALPAGLGGGTGVRCDIVPIGRAEGLTLTDAIVDRAQVGGPA
jgi:hypothetical protein